MKKNRYEVNLSPKQSTEIDGYSAFISLVTKEGSDWQLLVNITGQGFYFNEISCIDENNCWYVNNGNLEAENFNFSNYRAVTEGVDSTGAS